MTWHVAPCRLHEYRKRVRHCRVCETARALTLDAIAVTGPVLRTAWERRIARRENNRRQKKRAA